MWSNAQAQAQPPSGTWKGKMTMKNHNRPKTEGAAAVACSDLLARIFRNPFQRVFKNHRHLITLLFVFLHPYWQISGSAAVSGQLQIGMLETAINIPMLDEAATLPKADVLGNLDACFSNFRNRLIICLDEIHPIRDIVTKWNRANEIPELAASAVGLSILGESVIQAPKNVADGEAKSRGECAWNPYIHIFISIVSLTIGFHIGWWHASMLANVQSSGTRDQPA